MIRGYFIAFASAALLGACATAGTLESRALDSGTAMDFAAPARRVTDAAKQTLIALGLVANGVSEEAGSTIINFQKGMTAFSWGELGRVVVSPNGATASRVFVDTEKMSQMQITGTSEAEFSRDIFAGIKQRLAN